jgi:F0F1-type ATP synthase membrane subunit b/b'
VSDATYEAIAAWSQIIGSILFMAALVWIWIKFIAPAVLASQARKNAELADAEARRDAALKDVEAAKADVASAATDAAAIAARAEGDATRLRERLVAEGRAEGERLIRNAGGELDRGRIAANDELRAELLDTALRIARGDAASLDAGTDKKLIAEVLDTADRGGNA